MTPTRRAASVTLAHNAVHHKCTHARFTFHDLRACYAAKHKQDRGTLPDLHANPATTARVYDRNKEVGRDSF